MPPLHPPRKIPAVQCTYVQYRQEAVEVVLVEKQDIVEKLANSVA